MTVGELCRRMSSQELTEWIAYTRHFEALPDTWRQTGIVASALIAPHMPRGKKPKPDDFIPLETPPRHEQQDREALMRLRRELGIPDDG